MMFGEIGKTKENAAPLVEKGRKNKSESAELTAKAAIAKEAANKRSRAMLKSVLKKTMGFVQNGVRGKTTVNALSRVDHVLSLRRAHVWAETVAMARPNALGRASKNDFRDHNKLPPSTCTPLTNGVKILTIPNRPNLRLWITISAKVFSQFWIRPVP